MVTRVGELCSANDEVVKLGIWDSGVGGTACAAHREIVFEERFSGDSVGVSASVVGYVICEIVEEGVVVSWRPEEGEGDSLRWTRRGRLSLCLRSRRSFFSFDDGRGGDNSLLGVGGRVGAGGGVIIMVDCLGERKGDTERVGGSGVVDVEVKKAEVVWGSVLGVGTLASWLIR